MVPKGFAAAIYFTASTLTASNILTLFLMLLLIRCSLFLDKLLYLMTLLKVMALGPMDLGVRPIALLGPLGSCSFSAICAHGSLLAGDLSLGDHAGTWGA